MNDEAQSALASIPIGTLVAGRYEVTRHVADGAIASVYQAKDKRSASGTDDVALKVLDPLRGTDLVGRSRFEREFAVLCKLSHKGTSRCFALERDGDLDVLVLEYVEGTTLAERLARGRIESVDEIVGIALAVAEAVEACHEEGILHRDLKPSNIVIHPERGPVVLDFGVAWFSASASLTRTGALIGSPQYMAPELFGSSFADARADVYAVGAILFEMLTGRAVRLGDTVAELAGRAAAVPPVVSTLRPAGHIPDWLDHVVARAVAPRPEDRFATMHEFARALRDHAREAKRGLQTRTVCPGCRTRHVVDVPFCVGCGRGVAWGLRAGSFGVQLVTVSDVDVCAQWIEARHKKILVRNSRTLRARLRHPPIPLVLGVSEESAEQILAEAKDAGCTAEMVHAKAIFGTGIKAAAATRLESFAAAGLHAIGVLALALFITWIALFPSTSRWLIFSLPAIVAVLGMVLATLYMRRPLLRLKKPPIEAHDAFARMRTVVVSLRQLQTPRARCLAAGALLRAAPALIESSRDEFDPATRDQIWTALNDALAASTQLDTHAIYLQGRTRSRITAAIEATRVRVSLNVEGADAELALLEQERADILDAAVAHDLSARRALESSEAISAALLPSSSSR